MNPKHLATLEFPKVLDRLAAYASFSAGEEKARALVPVSNEREIRRRLETTGEARALLDAKPGITLGGARDVRPTVDSTCRGVVLSPPELLDVRDTLIAARTLQRALTALRSQFSRLADIADGILLCPDVVDEVNRCLDDRGNVRDEASSELARIRREMRIAHDRLQDKLQAILNSPDKAIYLQELLITQREGRYVIPLKADFKGRIRGIVHDVSASGATVFIEPLAVVDLNNAWREYQLAETQEVNRILTALSALIAEHADGIDRTVEALAELDLAFAKARYAEAINAVAPEIVPFRKSASESRATVRFIRARHPLLDARTVVPIDVVLDEETHVLVITGPNTGGKTVGLKTVGLLTLMAQAGLHLPLEAGSALSSFKTVYADIGDEQSIEQSLSTFSAHLTNILSFLDRADEHSLVLLDELGAGTDPAEGSALARALLEHFRQRGAMTFVATHYPELKAYAQLTPGVCNACVEFDPETLSPTYKLSVGLPGRSNAFAVARRLGLPRQIVDKARRMVSSDNLQAEDMLADIHRLRLQEAQARDMAAEVRAEAERLTRELRERLGAIEQERQEILAKARAEAATELESVQEEGRRLRRRLQAAAQPLDKLAAVVREIDSLREQLEEPQVVEPLPLPDLESRPLHPGDAVRVRPLNAKGYVLLANGEEVEVQVGPARTRVSRADLELLVSTPALEEMSERVYDVSPVSSPGQRLDVRGFTAEEALERLDRHLDASFRVGLPWVSIIHGKGTGALRRAVRQFLADHPLVGSYEAGDEREGGEGVTIAKLV